MAPITWGSLTHTHTHPPTHTQELWFESGPLDMAWINKFMVTSLMVLYKMNRFHAVLDLGE